MTEVNKQLGENNATLTQAIDDLMAKYFKETDEKAESRINRLEKRIDSTHSTLSKHPRNTDNKLRYNPVKRAREWGWTNCLTVCGNNAQISSKTHRNGGEKKELKVQMLWIICKNTFPSGTLLSLTPAPELMWCHRLGRLPKPGTGNKPRRPRPLIIRCFRYTDRDRILKESRKNPPEVANIQLQFAADYSEATSKHRKSCYKVMH